MGTLAAILVIILTPVLWFLTHKYFRFIYFGNIGNAILGELIECFFISLFIVCAVGAAGNFIISGIGSILLFILKAVLIIAAIIVVIFIIAKIVSAIKRKKSGTDDSKTEVKTTNTKNIENTTQTIIQDNVQQASTEAKNNESLTDTTINEVPNSDNQSDSVEEYIKQHYKKEDYIKAIKYYREKTGLDFETSKSVIDRLLQ